MPFLIIQTGTTLPEIRARRGDFPAWFRRGMGLARGDVRVVRVDAGETLPDHACCSGIVITGSGAMVSERLDWSERTAAWLRTAVGAKRPVLGVCYGHQLLAHALGGRVDYNPRGREIGTVEIECLPGAANDRLLGNLPARFRAQATHRQSVLELPVGAVALARSTQDAHQAVRYAASVWGLQFHPEFSATVMRAYIAGRAAALCEEGADPVALARAVRPAPLARGQLRRFRALATATHKPGGLSHRV